MQILNLFVIATQICPFFFTRKHVTAPCKYCIENRERQKIQELYPLILASPYAAQRRGQNEKKVQKAENCPAPPLVQAKKNL